MPLKLRLQLIKQNFWGGVDVDLEDVINEDNIDDYVKLGKEVSKANNAVVAITGPIDIITNGEKNLSYKKWT